MIDKVIRAPVNLFFDVIKTGTLINRFSKDMEVIDEKVSETMSEVLFNFYESSAFLVVMLVLSYYFIFLIPLLFYICFKIFSYAVSAYRECNRVSSVTRSPVLNYISETFNGVSTIRAFRKEDDFFRQHLENIDKNILATQFEIGCWCWFGVRMDLLSIILMTSISALCLLCKDSEDPVVLAMILAYVLHL